MHILTVYLGSDALQLWVVHPLKFGLGVGVVNKVITGRDY
jgi:hypothetical protein